jgi:hypothetical protein
LQLQILEPGGKAGKQPGELGGIEAYILRRSLDLATETDPDDEGRAK